MYTIFTHQTKHLITLFLANSIVLLGLLMATPASAMNYCHYQSPVQQRVGIVKDYTRRKPTITLDTSAGQEIRSAARGTVQSVDTTKHRVVVEHSNNFISIYKNITVDVVAGDTVKQGSPLGTALNNKGVGFRIEKRGVSKDPYCIVNPEREVQLTEYKVNDGKIRKPTYIKSPRDYRKKQRSTKRHRDIWQRFTTIVPANQRTHVSGFDIFTDGSGGVYGAVYQDSSNPTRWRLAMDVNDAFRKFNKRKLDNTELNYTLIHEFGHLLTLKCRTNWLRWRWI